MTTKGDKLANSNTIIYNNNPSVRIHRMEQALLPDVNQPKKATEQTNNEQLPRIPYLAGMISDDAISAAIRVLKSESINRGPLAPKLEEEFSRLVGTKYAVTTSSCTGALHLALHVAGVMPGDEVITTPLTFIGSNMAILYNGGVPVFTDLKPETLNIDPKSIASKITHKTKAILVVHLAGMPCDMDEIRAIAKANNLIVIEDAAQACGATYKGSMVGSLSDLTCFSFDPYKPLPSGDGGGIVTTNNLDYYNRLKTLVDYGFQYNHDGDFYKKYAVKEVGMKYYMRELSAAMVSANIPHFQKNLEWRRYIAHRYLDELRDVPGFHMTQYQFDRVSSYYAFIAFVERRPAFFDMMKSYNITVGIPAIRNDIAPVFGGKRQDLPLLNSIEHKYIGLPTHNKMTEEDVTRVIQTIKKGW